MENKTLEKGVPIRSVSRSIAVLREVNQRGSMSMMDIAHASEVPYPTACRIVQTLLYEGLIEREPARKRYRPTALVQTLASGFQDHSRLTATARPDIVALTKRFLWPVTITTRVGRTMMVRDSTHALTSLTFDNYHPGFTLPLLECASGRAYMAHIPEEERRIVLDSIRNSGDEIDPHTFAFFEAGILVDEIRANGYAARGRNRFTTNPGKTSSIAAPIFQNDRVLGAVALVFFAAAMKLDDAVNRFADDLKATARDISAKLSDREAYIA